MGGYDVYCAICGGPFGVIAGDQEYEYLDDDEKFNRDIVNPTTTEWTHHARVMGENPNSESMSKVFVSGPASQDDAAFFNIDGPNDDENFPADVNSLRVYDKESDYPLAIPFHDECYDLMQAKIGPAAFRPEILYHTFDSHVPGEFVSVLSVDWGTPGPPHEQYYMPQGGEKEYLLCPTDIPPLQEYYAKLPRLEARQQLNQRVVELERPVISTDIFHKLPAEMLLLLIDHVSLRDMLALRRASTAVHRLELTKAFWRGRLVHDMPWLHDIPAEAWTDESVDWCTVYKDLSAASQRTHKDCILALVNRRRIWTTMDQIMDTYFDEWNRVKSETSPILRDVLASRMPVLIWPEPSNTQRSLAPLLDNFGDIDEAQPRITVHWNPDGDVSGLTVARASSLPNGDEDVIGQAKHSAKTDDFVLPVDDWISEVTLVTEPVAGAKLSDENRRFVGIEFSFVRRDTISLGATDGSRRVLRPAAGNVIIGFMGGHGSHGHGQISKIALLEQPRDRFQPDCPRIAYAAGTARDTTAEVLLWRSGLPDPRLLVSQHQKAYWSWGYKDELFPMETLLFAKTDAEWASMTSISGDMHMGGIRIEYANREPRICGARFNAVRSMRIDGAGGERIVSIIAHVEHIITGLRFITNRARHLLVGLPGYDQNRHRYSSPELGGRELVGMYCTWLDRSSPKSRMEAFGVFYKDHGALNNNFSPAEASEDSRGFFWDPSSPPSSLTESGRVWGEWSYDWPSGNMNITYSFPKNGSIVSWLDCSRPIEEVEVISCHPQNQRRLNVCAVAFQYADGERERVAVGYSDLTLQGEQVTDSDLQHWCQCKRGQQAPFVGDGPHFQIHRWKPPQQLLHMLRIWLNEHGALSGMQFVDAAGNESRLWGFNSDEGTSGKIRFQGGAESGRAVGVKFFLNDNNRAVTYNDVVVVALQAIVKA